jgi:hypothetical protein
LLISAKLNNAMKRFLDARKSLPVALFRPTEGGKYRVYWLINRQRPSVEPSYDFDEERFGVTLCGEIIWGFHSGCS